LLQNELFIIGVAYDLQIKNSAYDDQRKYGTHEEHGKSTETHFCGLPAENGCGLGRFGLVRV
jgi:hypothetical protein